MKATLLLLSILALSYNSISQSLLADEKFQMDGINEVDIRGSFCEVEITGQSDQTLYFDGWIRGRSGKSYEIEYDRQGSLLKVWINSPRSSWGSIDCKLDLRIPKGIDVTVDNSSGSVRATSLGGRNLRIEASSGSLDIRDVSNDLDLRTSSGSIELENLNGNLNSRSSSGSQRITGVNGNIESRASSGQIKFRDITGDIDAETSSGSISLDGFEGGLTLESTSGSQRGDRIELTGDSYFKSSSGSIVMELLNDLSTLDFDLQASSGSLRVGDQRAEDRYIDKRSGGIEIRGISSSGSQKYDN